MGYRAFMMRVATIVAVCFWTMLDPLFALNCRPLVERMAYLTDSDGKTKYWRDPGTVAPPHVSGAIGKKLLDFLTDPYLRTDKLRIIVITKKKPTEAAKRELVSRWSDVRVVDGDDLPGRPGIYRWVLDGDQGSLGYAISVGNLDAIYAEDFGTYRELNRTNGPNYRITDLRTIVGVPLTLESIAVQRFHFNLQQQRVYRALPNWGQLSRFLDVFAEVESFDIESFSTPTDTTMRIASHIARRNPAEARVYQGSRAVSFEGVTIRLRVKSIRDLRIILSHPLIAGLAEGSSFD